MKYIKLIMIFVCFMSCDHKHLQKNNNKFINLIIADVKDDFSDYIVIPLVDQSARVYEIAIPVEQIGSYYYKFKNIPERDYLTNERGYLEFLESVLKGEKLISLDSVLINNDYKEYLIDNKDFLELKKSTLEEIIKTYFNSSYKINKQCNNTRLNSVIKILFINEILVTQDDFSGDYQINTTPLVKSILGPKKGENNDEKKQK